MTAPIDIRPHDLDTVRLILRAILPPEAKVWVFGSRATWTTKDSSDLDLAIDAGRPLTRDEESALRDAFEDSDLPYKVDVVDMQTVSETFRKIVEAGKVSLSLGGMKNTIEQTKLLNLAEILGGFAFKSNDFGCHGIPVVKLAAIEPPLVDIKKCEHILPEKASGLERFKIINGDIVMAMTGATKGKVGRYSNSTYAFINQRVAKISAKAGKSTDDFIYAILTQPGFDQIILSQAHGSAQPNISASDIGRIMVPSFDYKVQTAIGNFIRVLDDTIDLNRRMNETLETMARELFTDWFVDFGPTRAKAEGREPYLAPDVWSLFPERCDNQDKPEGWQNGILRNICQRVESGGTPAPNIPAYWDAAKIPWLTSSEVRAPIILRTSQSISELGLGLANSNAKLWPKYSVVVAMDGATAGAVCLLGTEVTANQGCCGLIPMNFAREFLFLYARAIRSDLESKATRSAQQHLSQDLIANHPIIFPGNPLLEAFSYSTAYLIDKWIANEQVSHTLAQTRDFLLPKLISGEIRIREAEKLVVAAI